MAARAAGLVADLAGSCWRMAGRATRLLAGWAGWIAHRMGALISAAARCAGILIAWGRRPFRLVARLIGDVGQVAVWLLRPFAGAGSALLRGVAAIGHALGGLLAVVWRAASRFALACGHFTGSALIGIGNALRPVVSAANRSIRAIGWLIATCFKWISRGVASALTAMWTAAVWASRRLLAPFFGRIGWALGWASTVLGVLLKSVGRVLGVGLRLLWSGMRVIAAPAGRLAARVAAAVGHALAAGAAPVGGVIRQVMNGLARPIRTAGAAIKGRRRAVAQGALVAFGTARHQARSVAGSARDSGWRSAIPQPSVHDETGDQLISSVFTTASFQNEYMAPGASRVHAIVSIAAEHTGGARTNPDVVELIIVDCSASMGHPWEKIQAARSATRAAVEALRDGVWFAVIRGAESAEVAYPQLGGLVQASPDTKRAAVKAIGSLQPVGGTAIGRWLTVAAELVSLRPDAIHHAILLTDGKDEDETESDLDAAVASCEGLLQCDCRGVGTDWAVSELRKISSALLGSLDIIQEPAAMESDFRVMTEAAMARHLEASLRIWAPDHARINVLQQVSPAILDLTSRGRAAGPLTTEYPTGAWGTERREYHLSVEVRPGAVGAEMLASRVSVVVRNRIVAKALLKAIWTEDAALTAPLSPEVAHYIGQTELANAIQDGLQARRDSDDERAAAKLGRAVQLAAESGNEAIAGLLANVVDVDTATGTVRMRKSVDLSDEMTLDTRSTKTVRLGRTED